MELKLTDIEELALKIDLARVKDFNKAGYFDVDGKYKAYVETASWAEEGIAPVTVMIYQETEDQSFRVIVAYISAPTTMAGAVNGTKTSDFQLICLKRCGSWKSN